MRYNICVSLRGRLDSNSVYHNSSVSEGGRRGHQHGISSKDLGGNRANGAVGAN